MAVFNVEIDIPPILCEVPESVQRGDTLRKPVGPVRGAEVRRDLEPLELWLQNDIYDARDGIRAIDRRGAVLEHFDSLDHSKRQRRQIDKWTLAVVGERIRRHPMPIDQHERRIERQPAQRYAARAAGECAAEVLRQRAAVVGRQCADDVSNRELAALFDLRGVDHLHRRGRLNVSAPNVGSGDDDGHEGIAGLRAALLCVDICGVYYAQREREPQYAGGAGGKPRLS